ncbi:hypothetical protein OS493_003583 [Desmophyllum pertusum]|uniref:Uncharacterized protein n=1 Tax=Desmophyllum pertusum TaxID=174260 RepID=A0A9X0DDD7_9CNID|nr:hypothetical protein OS493_003583 [Desmophyllum pertusum]
MTLTLTDSVYLLMRDCIRLPNPPSFTRVLKDVTWQNILMKGYNGGLSVKLVLFFPWESAK